MASKAIIRGECADDGLEIAAEAMAEADRDLAMARGKLRMAERAIEQAKNLAGGDDKV